jgi:hypothetical protein
MRREPLVAVLGLLACSPRASSLAPTPPLASGGEPTGRGQPVPEPAPTRVAGPPPQVWCEATIDTRPRPLVRTPSFLLAMQALREANLPRALAKPLSELAARTDICGSTTCTPSPPRAIELYEGNEFGVGTVLDAGAGELLVIPDVSPYLETRRCPAQTTLAVEPLDALVHVWSDVAPTPVYTHFHDEYGGFGYYCNAPHARRDVIVDPRSDTQLVDIVHGQVAVQVIPELRGEVLQLTLVGCNTSLELEVPRAAASP